MKTVNYTFLKIRMLSDSCFAFCRQKTTVVLQSSDVRCFVATWSVFLSTLHRRAKLASDRAAVSSSVCSSVSTCHFLVFFLCDYDPLHGTSPLFCELLYWMALHFLHFQEIWYEISVNVSSKIYSLRKYRV